MSGIKRFLTRLNLMRQWHLIASAMIFLSLMACQNLTQLPLKLTQGSLLIEPYLSLSPSVVDFGGTVLIKAYQLTPNAKVEFMVESPEIEYGGRIWVGIKAESNSRGEAEIAYSKEMYDTKMLESEDHYLPVKFAGVFSVYIKDLDTKKKSEWLSFEIKKPPLPPLNPALKLETYSDKRKFATSVAVIGSDFSRGEQVKLIISGSQGIKIETEKSIDFFGRFVFSFDVPTELAYGDICYQAQVLKTGKKIDTVCQPL